MNHSHTPSASTTVFNLIILDESGSMSGVQQQTISGCNETLNVIRSNAQLHPELRSLVSIYAFQDGGPIKSRYLVKNVKASEITNVTAQDYKPWGSTPLYDAVGSTLTELMAVQATHEDATGIITIITDGYENSSTQYSMADVARILGQFREMGWTVNLIGANIDVEKMADNLNIDNRMSFTQTAQGTQDMFTGMSNACNARYETMAQEAAVPCMAERQAIRKKNAKGFFRK